MSPKLSGLTITSLVVKEGVEPIELDEPREAVERARCESELLAPVG